MNKEVEKYPEEKMKKLKTSEILNVVGDFDRGKLDTDWDKKSSYENELQKREPFDHIKNKLQKQQKEIKELQDMIKELTYHSHDVNGHVVTPIKKDGRTW